MQVEGEGLRRPDIVAVQELWSFTGRRRVIDQLSEYYPHHIYVKNGILGTGLLILTSYPIVDFAFESYQLNGYYYHLTRGDYFGGKGVVQVTLKLTDGSLINVLNTHLIANYSSESKPDGYYAHRIIQAYQLSNVIARSKYPVLLLGDLNVPDDSLEYKLITQQLDDVMRYAASQDDLVTKVNNEVQNTFMVASNLYSAGTKEERIDYILSGDCLKLQFATTCMKRQVDGLNISDHYGVFATFNYDKQHKAAGSFTNTAALYQDAQSALEQEVLQCQRWKRQEIFKLIVAFMVFVVVVVLSGLFGFYLSFLNYPLITFMCITGLHWCMYTQEEHKLSIVATELSYRATSDK